MYVSEFEMNYTNASLSEASASLSEAIQCEVRYCEVAKVQANLETISDRFGTVR
jgi:hypothetical protein